MKHITKAAFLVLALGASACTNGGRFDNAGGGAGAGMNEVVPGTASDPTSPAYFQQIVGDRILFLVDQATLDDEGRNVLSQQAAWLMQNTTFTAIIEGHADEQGTREYNLALGARRASAVQNYLIERGVAANRLRTVSYGKERPIEICSDEACYSQNRRSVTVISAVGLSS